MTTTPDKPQRFFSTRTLIWALPLILILAGVLSYPTISYRLTHVVTDDAFVDAPLVAVSASIPGRIANLLVSEGDTIQMNQAIAHLQDGLVRAELNAAQARVDQTQSLLLETDLFLEIERRKAGPTAEREQAELVAWQARLSGALIALDEAERHFQRVQKLSQSALVSNSELEIARIRRDKSQAELDAVREEVHKATASQALSREIIEGITLHKQRVETARAELRRAEAEREAAHIRLDNTEIRSPVHGVVALVNAQPGERIEEGQTICLIRNLDDIWIIANIEETQIRHVQTDQIALITIDAFPKQTFAGKVINVGSVTKSQVALLPRQSRAGNFVKVIQRIPVRIALNNANHQLRPGMSAIVGIRISSP